MLVSTMQQDRAVVQLRPRARGVEASAWSYRPAHRNLAVEALDATNDFAPWKAPGGTQGEGVSHFDAAVLSVECGFQHLRLADVAAGHLKRILWSEFEVAAADRVEKCSEYGRRVHRREWPPVDLPVGCDQSDGATVAQGSVVLDRCPTIDTRRLIAHLRRIHTVASAATAVADSTRGRRFIEAADHGSRAWA